MNIIICGAGGIGSHAAEAFAASGHDITVVDANPDRARAIGEDMDVATFTGNAAQANVLRDAGAADADLVVAATDVDEINLLCASIAKGVGARKCLARVHHSAYFEERGLDYQGHLGIDRLICPEYATALAIARKLRNPGAVAIENLARGLIEMQEIVAGDGGSAVGKRLVDVRLPEGARLALIRRKKEAFIPEATSVVAPGDRVILVGNRGVFEDARKRFQGRKATRRKIVLMGGPPMAVWLCRALRDRSVSVRLFERDRERAEELAEKLDWVTVIRADPTDRSVFDEESLSLADSFVALLDDDEANIIAGVLAKTRGVPQVLTVVQQPKYLDLVYDIGVDHVFSTRVAAGEEIDRMLDEGPLRHLGTLAEGLVDVYRVRVGTGSPVAGKPLREIGLSPDWVIAAIQHGSEDAAVPGADARIEEGDIILVVGRHGRDDVLTKLFAIH